MRRTMFLATIAIWLVLALLGTGASGTEHSGPQPGPSPSACDDGWQQIDTDDGRSGNGFSGIAVRSRRRVWAVGDARTRSGAPDPLIKRWDGSGWSRERVRGSFYLHDADTGQKGPVWAVGEGSSGSTLFPVALKRTPAGRWRRTEVARPGSTLTAVNDVSALGPRRAWITGTYWDSSAAHRVLIERWTGTRWVHVPFAPTGLAEDVFARSWNDVWVVGRTGRNGNQVTLTLRYNGKRWRTVPSPNVNSNPHILEGVASTGRRRAWAVGSRSNPRGGSRPLIMRWNGRNWRYVELFPNREGEYTAISAFGDELVIVGQDDWSRGVVVTYDGTRWTREILEFRDADELLDAEHAPNGSVFVGGRRSTTGGSEAVFYRPPLCP